MLRNPSLLSRPAPGALGILLLSLTLALIASPRSDAAGPPVDVIVFLDNGAVAANASPSTHAADVQAAQDAALANVSAEDVQVTYRYRTVPAIAARVSTAALDRLRDQPGVLRVAPDFAGHGADIQSSALIRADDAHNLGYYGQGVVVGVIDSGINEGHPDLAPAIAHEECFMSASALSSRCPNGAGRQSGPGAAADGMGHGSNVAGIIAGRGTASPIGMAPLALLEVYKIIDDSNTFYFSDLIAAVDDIVTQHPEVRVVNMSLGTASDEPPSSCLSDSVFDTLRGAGIIAFASAMNQGYKDGMGYPACVDSIVSVGSVYDADIPSFGGSPCTDAPANTDHVACWSNSDATLDLLAPGCRITSAGLSSAQSTYCGTSQASPHAAGLAALLIGKSPGTFPDAVEGVLKATGVLITDPWNGVTTPRIDALAAVSAQIPTPTPSPTPSPAPTPTPTPAPTPIACESTDDCAVSGDANCDLHVDFSDAVTVLEDAGGIRSSPCPNGANVKCDDPLNAIDALLIVQKKAGVAVDAPVGCKAIG